MSVRFKRRRQRCPNQSRSPADQNSRHESQF
jgi:hypothetical protein